MNDLIGIILWWTITFWAFYIAIRTFGEGYWVSYVKLLIITLLISGYSAAEVNAWYRWLDWYIAPIIYMIVWWILRESFVNSFYIMLSAWAVSFIAVETIKRIL